MMGLWRLSVVKVIIVLQDEIEEDGQMFAILFICYMFLYYE